MRLVATPPETDSVALPAAGGGGGGSGTGCGGSCAAAGVAATARAASVARRTRMRRLIGPESCHEPPAECTGGHDEQDGGEHEQPQPVAQHGPQLGTEGQPAHRLDEVV